MKLKNYLTEVHDNLAVIGYKKLDCCTLCNSWDATTGRIGICDNPTVIKLLIKSGYMEEDDDFETEEYSVCKYFK